jgi:hypothetical protein
MRNVITGLAFAALLLAPLVSNAKPGNQAHVQIPFLEADGTTFSAEDMTGPAQTAVMDVRGFTWLTFYVSVASISGTADVTVNCNTGPTSTDVNYALQSESIASGTATFSDYVPTKSVTTSDKFPVTVSVLNKGYLQCTFTCASGTVDATAWTW